MPEVAEQLIRFAAELEHRALELEKRAASIAKTVARTRKRSGEIRRLVEDASQHTKRLRRQLKSGGSESN